MRITDRKFFEAGAEELARALLGKYLCAENGGAVEKHMITETECYVGADDTACHASRGKTARNAPLWDKGGLVYVYLCYGIHWLFNIVAGAENEPEGVLIRGVEGFSGPGRVTKAFGIDGSLRGENVLSSQKIWVEDAGIPAAFSVSKRVGIDYAAPADRDRLWRFVFNTAVKS